MRHAVFVAPFGPLADPYRLIDLAHACEETGWDGLFLWDHVLRPESNEIIDPWVSLGVIAAETHRLRLGTMVTPLVRRRMLKLAREVLTVDLLSSGRVTLGVGLGVDTHGELTRTGEMVDPKIRGAMLDEGLPLLADLLSGEVVDHAGEHYVLNGIGLEPNAVQQPRPPIWLAARGGAGKPVRRAACYDGIFPIEIDSDRFPRILEEIMTVRGDLDGFDIAVKADPGTMPPPFTHESATWVMHAWPAVADLDHVFDVVGHGPPE